MVFVKSFHRRWAIVLVVSFHAAVRRVAGYGSPSSVASLKHLKPVKCLRGRKIGRSGAKVALKAQESQQHERANDGRANLVDDAQPSSVINQSPSYTPLASSMALVAGNAVGAGVLALPETSFPAGFGPSAVVRCEYLMMPRLACVLFFSCLALQYLGSLWSTYSSVSMSFSAFHP